MPGDAVSAVREEVIAFGKSRVETGGFLLAPVETADGVTVLALAGDIGVTRRRGLFAISGIALDRLFAFADAESLRVPAQFHSHGRHAFLSPTDLAHGLRVRNFVTCVVPFWNDPPPRPDRWGWWRFDGEEWRDEPAPEVVVEPVRVVRFDEDGVR